MRCREIEAQNVTVGDMATFDPRLYGARWAENYDEWHAGMLDDEGAVEALAKLADGGPVLEFGVGTGRLAVPLAERGLDVVGVDISADMLAKLREKSSAVTVVEDSMTTVRLSREFDLVFVGFSSIFVLGTQREQVDLFRNAARHLRSGGRFALETWVTTARPNDGGRSPLNVTKIEPDRVTMVAAVNDPVTGLHRGMWMTFEPDGVKFFPIDGRNVTHHEMDLMAELAGLELESRCADWKGTPFDKDAKLHVSIYRKP